MNLKQRESELLALTELDREEGSESNPILFAESGPNRFNIMSLFFPGDDGVKIQEDLELNLISVYYFNEEGQTELTSGAIYEWATKYYEDNF